MTSLSPNILPQVAALTTSAEDWKSLHVLYASESETRLLHLRFQLQNVKKEGASMSEYLKRISVFKDKLAAAGEGLKDAHLILITLGGLGPEYQSFVTSITTRMDHTMSFAQLKHLLMDHDLQLSSTKPTLEVNVATKAKNQ